MVFSQMMGLLAQRTVHHSTTTGTVRRTAGQSARATARLYTATTLTRLRHVKCSVSRAKQVGYCVWGVLYGARMCKVVGWFYVLYGGSLA